MSSNPQPPIDRVTVTVDNRVICRITRDRRTLIVKDMTLDEARRALEHLLTGTGNLIAVFETAIGAWAGDREPTPGCFCPSCALIHLHRTLQEPHLH